MEIGDIKKAAVKKIDSSYRELRDLSRKIHANPETAMEEHKASAWLCAYLEKNGFKVEKGIYDLPTAFRGKYGKGRPAIAFLSEYDALPKVGHACGHNLIAVSSVAAGVACREAVDRLGGSIIVYGTATYGPLICKTVAIRVCCVCSDIISLIYFNGCAGKGYIVDNRVGVTSPR